MLRVGLHRVQTLFPFSTTNATLKLQQLFKEDGEVSRETVLAVDKSRLKRSMEQ